MTDIITSMNDMESAARRYEQDKKFAQAREVRGRLVNMQRILSEHYAQNSDNNSKSMPILPAKKSSGNRQEAPVNSPIDFFNPTEQMIAEAKKLHNLDLTDKK